MTKKNRYYSKSIVKPSHCIVGSQYTEAINKDQSPSEKELDKELAAKFKNLGDIEKEFWKKHPGKQKTPKHNSGTTLSYENKLEIMIPNT